MINEIGAGLIAAGSVLAAATSMAQSRRKVRTIQGDLDDARARAEAMKESLSTYRHLANERRETITSRDRTIRTLDSLCARLAGERDDARRALQAAKPVRGERGRFAKRPARSVSNAFGVTGSDDVARRIADASARTGNEGIAKLPR